MEKFNKFDTENTKSINTQDCNGKLPVSSPAELKSLLVTGTPLTENNDKEISRIENHKNLPPEEAGEPPKETLSDWLLLMVAFFYDVVVGLEVTSFGVLYGDISQHFDASQASVGWCLGIQYITAAMSSILASYPIQRYGCRLPGTIGSVLFAVGVGTSSFAPNLATIYVFYGLLAGVGYSFSVISCAVVVQQRFNKNRGLANSISSLGYSVGSITGPQITRLLLSGYGWSGALLLMGAIQAHRIPLAMFFRSPSQKISAKRSSAGAKSINQCNENQMKSELKPVSAVETPFAHNSERNEIIQPHSPGGRRISKPFNESTLDISSPVNTSIANIDSPDVTAKSGTGMNLIRYIRDALDFSLLKRPQFALLMTAMCLMVFTFGYLAHLPGFGVKSGLTMATSVWALSTMSFSSLVGKLVVSVITSFQCVSRIAIYTMGLSFGALSLFTIVFVPAPAGFFLSAVLFGSQLACTSSINHVLLVDLMGIKLLPRCFSIQFFLTGIFRLAGPPFVGWMYDITEQYSAAFLCFAGVDLLGVTLMIVLYCVANRANNNNNTPKPTA